MTLDSASSHGPPPTLKLVMDKWRIDPRRITEYLLNPNSEAGLPKARFFQAGGFTSEHWPAFADALLAHTRTATLEEVDDASPYGTKYVFRCTIETPDRRNPCILSVWQ